MVDKGQIGRVHDLLALFSNALTNGVQQGWIGSGVFRQGLASRCRRQQGGQIEANFSSRNVNAIHSSFANSPIVCRVDCSLVELDLVLLLPRR